MKLWKFVSVLNVSQSLHDCRNPDDTAHDGAMTMMCSQQMQSFEQAGSCKRGRSKSVVGSLC